MNILIRSALGIAAFSIFASAQSAPPVVNPEQMDLDPDILAKINKEKSKRDSSALASGGSGSSKDCGTVNINSNEKKSNSGIGSMIAKPTTTIITGPVINMANCK